jgi:peptide/nickel transport system substrate-binding protein
VPQANLTALDPIWTSAIVTQMHGYHVYDTLFAVDAAQKPHPADGRGPHRLGRRLVWRIRLRPGLRFHDGEPVRARDCAASLERWSKRDAFGQILARAVERWSATDDRTLEIRLTRPFPLLLDALAKPDANVAFIMPERLARTDANTQVSEVIGSGPYRFLKDEFVTGSRVTYAKNDGLRAAAGHPTGPRAARSRIFRASNGTSCPTLRRRRGAAERGGGLAT